MSENISGQKLPYRNPDLPVEERIDDLLSRMTLEEKVGQMMQLDARSGDLDDLIVNRHVGSILHTSPDDLPRAAETVNTKTRLGIPLIIGDDCIHGYSFWPGATIFPEQLGMAASWDPDKIESMGRATAEEVSATGVHWTFSPVLCIARDTRWGRVGGDLRRRSDADRRTLQRHRQRLPRRSQRHGTIGPRRYPCLRQTLRRLFRNSGRPRRIRG